LLLELYDGALMSGTFSHREVFGQVYAFIRLRVVSEEVIERGLLLLATRILFVGHEDIRRFTTLSDNNG